MRDKWSIKVGSNYREFATAAEAAEFIRTAVPPYTPVGLYAPDEATGTDWHAFKGMEISAMFGKTVNPGWRLAYHPKRLNSAEIALGIIDVDRSDDLSDPVFHFMEPVIEFTLFDAISESP